MIPRRLDLDFSEVPMCWTRVPEFGLGIIATSPIAPPLERYINRVMANVVKALPDKDSPLVQMIKIFCAQEANHYKLHEKFNERLYQFYPKLREIERDMAQDYRSFLQNKSLAFNAGYCAGFENIALFITKYYYEVASHMFDGADQTITTFYMWHYAEEFEHRCVAHAAFAAVSGNYFQRVRGILAAIRHLTEYKNRMVAVVLEVERANMTPAERKESERRMREVDGRYARYTLPKMLRVAMPFYNPASIRPTPKIQQNLDYFAAITAA